VHSRRRPAEVVSLPPIGHQDQVARRRRGRQPDAIGRVGVAQFGMGCQVVDEGLRPPVAPCRQDAVFPLPALALRVPHQDQFQAPL